MIGTKYILDGRLKDVINQPESIVIKNSIVVYEVFTWENDNAIFFDEHYSRFLNSIEVEGLNISDIPTKHELFESVLSLAKANEFKKKNIRIDLIFTNGKLHHFLGYFVKSIFPTEEQYSKGVKVGLCFGERHNPKAKIANSEIREKANNKIREENLFEVLLVNRKSIIAEGSRSNVFFVKENIIYTPKSEKVLSGITRQKVLEIAENLKIDVVETDILADDLSSFDSAFLTSTSMIVLPISNIEEVKFNVENELIRKLYSNFKGIS